MPTYIITCPVCKKKYKLTPKDTSSLKQKTFVCPSCNTATPFISLIKTQDKPSVTTNDASVQNPHSKTKVSPAAGAKPKAYLAVIGGNTRLVVYQGVYILGRKSSDSNATLQIAPDITMSRQHARLSIQIVAGRLMAQIVGLKENNPIFVNGKMYVAGQPCTLKSGDNLQLGSTQVIFTI